MKTDQTLLWNCIGCANLQCVNNYHAKFEYKGMKIVGVTDYTHITQCKHSKCGEDVISLSSTLPKIG